MSDLMALLTAEGVTASGVLLGVLVVFAVSLNREWIITGVRFKSECTALRTALEACTKTAEQCGKDYTTAQIRIARQDERERIRRRK
jgi:hypothetical protein